MTDPYTLAQVRILSSMGASVYLAAPELVPLLVLKGVNLSVKHGNSSNSSFLYNGYGLFLCGAIGDIETGFEFGKMALRLSQKINAKPYEAMTQRRSISQRTCCKVLHRESLKPLEIAFKKGLETGDFEYSASCAYICSYFSFFAGKNLSKMEQKISKYNDSIKKLKNQTWLSHNERIWQIILNLKGCSENPATITGDVFDEKRMIELYLKQNDRSAICSLHIEKLVLNYLFHEYNTAIKNAVIAEKDLISLISHAPVPVFYFYDSLAQLALFFKTSKKQKNILKKIKKNKKKIKKWAHHAPMNHLHKWQLVEAEKARVLGKDKRAIEFYDLAISGAKENQFIQEEALANELAAKFYIERDEIETAKKYMKEARFCYEHWGAKAKVDHLNQNYPELLADDKTLSSQESIHAEETTLITTSKSTSNPMKGEQLDLTSVMKASQVISGEIQIEKLLSSMMRIIIENAGAEKGYLLLKSDDNLLIEAEGNINQKDVQVLQSTPLGNSLKVPKTIIQYVARVKESIVLEDATSKTEFTTDPYIAKLQPKSLLCAPLIHQNNLSGIIYLENNLTTGAFTKERLEVLPLLCSQAAISLENANLYKQQQEYSQILEETVTKRTVELEQSLDTIKQTQEQLVQSEKMAALGGLVAGVAHEINTPIGVAVSAASHLEDKTSEFIDKVESKKVRKLDLDHYTKTASNASNLILKNLSGAVKIVQGFKQVAVDQTSGERREFKLKAYIDDALLSLQPKIKKTNHQIQVSCPEDLSLTSFPGALSQIVSNLVMNSLIHGFEGIEEGRISFEISVEANAIEIVYQDNGVGMDDETLSKVFDPFFTTKRSQGGSGLGMHIVHNLVTQTLGGSIACESRSGYGITLTIQIPTAEK